ncbi:MAG: RdgB/HAM1 family non-canonical purine NTP pyrophosphatase [Bdellovibrionales bacterium]|nr:RdgB/HAM1 family non-canonical purine NTP pyrophosphatase [Bdellovibrionales bacterium]
MKEILFATSNEGKLKDARRFFLSSPYKILSLQELRQRKNCAPPPEVEETGTTYKENALLKAVAYYKWSGLPTVADDSGLEVDALGGQPGVYTARYAGEGCTYDDNMDKLLAELGDNPYRSARFICVLAYTTDGTSAHYFKGIVEGEITMKKIGTAGFGYDPVFRVSGSGKTLSELKGDPSFTLDSHRARAFEKFVKIFQ